MRRGILLIGFSVAAIVGILAVTVGLAGASNDTVRAQGTNSFEPNTLIQSTFHWNPGQISVASGGQLRFAAQTEGFEPHTISVVTAAQVPKTVDQVFQCSVCNKIFGFLDGHRVYDPGNDGLNADYDTWFLPPGKSVTVTVSAPAGTLLHFICAIHPWMQGVINVTS